MLLRMTPRVRTRAANAGAGFNEAGAMLLRMTFQYRAGSPDLGLASMRPEQCCSG